MPPVPPRRTIRDLLIPRDVTETARQGQGIGDLEAMRQAGVEAGKQILGALPVTGEAMAAKDFADAAKHNDRMGMALATLGVLPMGTIAGKVAKEISPAIREAAGFIPGWHASKADVPFEKFSRAYYGRGAGGNAMGEATYLTNAYPESIEYLKAVTAGRPSRIVTKTGNTFDVPLTVATDLRRGEDIGELINKFSSSANQSAQRLAEAKSSMARKVAERSKRSAEEVLYPLLTAQQQGIASIERPGTLYRLGADVDKEAMINFDKDLIDQSSFVQDVLNKTMGLKPIRNNADQMIAYNSLLNRGIRQPGVAEKLEAAGIQGGYRSSPMSTHKATNFAVFDPDRIKILQALGLLGAVSASRQMSDKEQ